MLEIMLNCLSKICTLYISVRVYIHIYRFMWGYICKLKVHMSLVCYYWIRRKLWWIFRWLHFVYISFLQHQMGWIEDGPAWGTQQSQLQNHCSSRPHGNDYSSVRFSWNLWLQATRLNLGSIPWGMELLMISILCLSPSYAQTDVEMYYSLLYNLRHNTIIYSLPIQVIRVTFFSKKKNA